MNADEARESLAFSEYARKRAREDMGRPWLALVLLATLSVASLSLTGAATSPTALFWVFVGPVGAGAIALYAYRRSALMVLASLEPTPLERAESLEQLRALEHGIRIKTVETAYDSFGVDTPEDLEHVRRLLAAPMPS